MPVTGSIRSLLRRAGGAGKPSEQRLLGDVAVTYGGQIVGSGIGFAIQLILQRALGPADYGILALATSIGSLSLALTDAGISHAMIRFGSLYLSEAPERAMARFTAALVLRVVLAVGVSGAGLLASGWLALSVMGKPELIGPLTWVYLGLLGGTLYGYWIFFVQAHQRFVLRSAVVIFSAVLRLAGLGAIYALTLLTPTAMIIVDALVCFTGFAVGIFFSPRGLSRWNGPEVRASLAEIVPYCRFTGVLVVSELVFSELDTLMLGAFSDEHTVGLYRAAWNYALVLAFLNMSVSNVLFPKVTSVSDVAELRAFMRRILRLTGGLAVCTLPVLPLVAWWIPWYEIRFADATTIFYVMYVGLVFQLFVGPLGFILYSVNRPGILVNVALVKLAFNVAGNLLLIPLFGAHGAAWATVVTRLVGGAATVYMVLRILDSDSNGRGPTVSGSAPSGSTAPGSESPAGGAAPSS